MNEQLISFDVAKLAKEVGFDWEVLFGMNIEGNRIPFDVEGGYTNWNKHNTYSVPPQSLLQKWFRDVHGVAVHISTDITLSWVYTIQSLHPQATYTGPTIASEEVFSTYEESLEKGLYRALKLIKNEN